MKSMVSPTLQCRGFLSSGRGLQGGGRVKWVLGVAMDIREGEQLTDRGEEQVRDRGMWDLPMELDGGRDSSGLVARVNL